MNYSEALAWMRGERSMTNIIPQTPFETWQVRIAEADSGMMAQAYWVLLAHKQGLLPKEECLTKVEGGVCPSYRDCQQGKAEPVLATCWWTEDGDGNWETGCGESWSFRDGGPKENGMRYCLLCGQYVKIREGKAAHEEACRKGG